MTDHSSDDMMKEPPASEGGDQRRATMTESDRATVFATGMATIDRAAALRAGSVPVPRKVILWIIVGFAVLGLGGIVAEKLIGNAGVGALILSLIHI